MFLSIKFITLFTHSNHGEKWAIWCNILHSSQLGPTLFIVKEEYQEEVTSPQDDEANITTTPAF